jgi:hypothetical protein
MTPRPVTTRLFGSHAPKPPAHQFTPRMQELLLIIAQGPLDKTPEGWVSRKGIEHEPFNSHTVLYLARRNYLSAGSRSASIMPAGEAVVRRLEEYGAEAA